MLERERRSVLASMIGLAMLAAGVAMLPNAAAMTVLLLLRAASFVYTHKAVGELERPFELATVALDTLEPVRQAQHTRLVTGDLASLLEQGVGLAGALGIEGLEATLGQVPCLGDAILGGRQQGLQVDLQVALPGAQPVRDLPHEGRIATRDLAP